MAATQFGVCAFCYRTGAEVPVQAQHNKWSTNWHESWFYYHLAGEPELTGDMPLLGEAKTDAVMDEATYASYDAVRLLAHYQSARDLVEEFCAVRVLPLKADQEWFGVVDNPRYEERGLRVLKVLVLDAKALWVGVLKGAKTEKVGLSRICAAVMAEVEDIVGKLGSQEVKAIAQALPGHDRVSLFSTCLVSLTGIGRCLLPKKKVRRKRRRRWLVMKPMVTRMRWVRRRGRGSTAGLRRPLVGRSGVGAKVLGRPPPHAALLVRLL